MKRITLARFGEWTTAEIAVTACLVPLILGCIVFAFLAWRARTPLVEQKHPQVAAIPAPQPEPVPPPVVPQPELPQPAASALPEQPPKPPASKAPEVSAVADAPEDEEPVTPEKKPPAIRVGSRLRLQGKGPIVMLAVAPAILEELLQEPDRLGALIQSGSLFTVNKGTVAEALEVHGDLVRVQIVEGEMGGRSGWISGSQVKADSK